MELQQLTYFKAAAEFENLSRAAEELYISQPALSKVIRRLEADLGTELFDRQGKTVRLNDTGRIALAYTNEILQSVENMRDSLYEQRLCSNHLLVISNLPNLIRYVIPCCLQENEGLKISGRYMQSIHSAEMLLKSNICDIVVSDKEEQIG